MHIAVSRRLATFWVVPVGALKRWIYFVSLRCFANSNWLFHSILVLSIVHIYINKISNSMKNHLKTLEEFLFSWKIPRCNFGPFIKILINVSFLFKLPFVQITFSSFGIVCFNTFHSASEKNIDIKNTSVFTFEKRKKPTTRMNSFIHWKKSKLGLKKYHCRYIELCRLRKKSPVNYIFITKQYKPLVWTLTYDVFGQKRSPAAKDGMHIQLKTLSVSFSNRWEKKFHFAVDSQLNKLK